MKYSYALAALTLITLILGPSKTTAQRSTKYQALQFEVNGKVYEAIKVNAPICELPADQQSMNQFMARANALRQSYQPNELFSVTATANFSVNYTGFTQEAQDAFQYAVDIWARTLVSDVTIEVEASFEPKGDGILGTAGSNFIYTDVTNEPFANTFYSAALANAIEGADINTNEHDINASFSNDPDTWYFGTDENPPFEKYDFVTVVLHELGHGLGFSGSGDSDGTTGEWGISNPPLPQVYDQFVVNSSDQRVLNQTNPSTALHTYLTSNELFLDGDNVLAANGEPAEIYAPDPFNGGSSYSHWGEAFNDTADDMMTFSITNGSAQHSVGPVTRALFKDMGWQINEAAAPTTDASEIIIDEITTSSMRISWTDGNGSARIVVAKQGSAPTGTPVNGTDYTADNNYSGNGDPLGDGIVVYNNIGSLFTLSGLADGTEYFLQVFEYNGTDAEILYKTGSPLAGSATTLIPDETAPVIDVLSPADNATDVLITTDLVITFDEVVQKRSSGNITIYDDNDQLLQTVAIISNDVQIADAVMTIDLPTYLPSSATVYVQIDAGAIEDTSGNPFAGIADNTSWNFTTSNFDCSGFTADNITINVDSEETNCDTPNGALSATVDVGGGATIDGYSFTWYNSNDLNTPIGNAAQIDGLAAGDYTVVVEDDATGCEAIKEATVIENKVISVLDDAVIADSEVCLGTPDGQITITVNGGQTNGFTFEWSIGGSAKATPDFDGDNTYTALGAGDYTVVAVNNTTGCKSESATFTVGTNTTDPVLGEAVMIPNGGCGSPGGQLSIATDAGLTNGFTFSWWDGATNAGQADFAGGPVYSGLTAGEYTVQVQNDATGCISETRTFEVTTATQDIPVVDAVVTNGEGCGLPGTGSVLVTMTSTNAPSSYNVQVLEGNNEINQAAVADGTTGITFDELPDGNYTVRVTDVDKGCFTDEAITLAYDAIPLTIPQNVTIGDITDETATVNWNSVAADATYEILYETANSDVLSEVGNSGVNLFDLAGLTDSTVYEVSVLAVCDNDGTPDKSDYSAVRSFKTLLLCGVDKTAAPTWYKDADGDGVGIASDVVAACEQPAGYVAEAGDCNDADPDVYPGAPKLPDGKDNDCDGIVDKSDQTLTFAPISNSLVSDETIELEAEATSGLNVTFTAVGPVTITGSVATITGLGEVVITATQAGNDFFNPAANVIRLFKVSKGDQVITFSELEDVAYAAQLIPYTVTIDTDLPLSIAVEGPAENTTEGLQITGVGVVTITASQAGNDLYNAATYSRSFEVTKGEQEITVTNSGGPFVPGDSSIITALSSVGLDVSLAVEGPARLVGTKVYFDAAGLVKIIASQEGNENYSSPQPAQLFIDVELAKTVIDPVELPEEAEEGESIALPATTPGGAPIIYTVTGPATIDADGNLVITGPGLVTLTSTLDENDLEEAEPLVESFCVFPPKPTISGVVDEVNQVTVFTSSSPEGNQWIRDNVTVAGETSQTYQIPSGVQAEIQVQVNIDGCESEISEVINGAGQQITGIEDLIKSGQLKAYPNPVQNIFNIELSAQAFDGVPMARLYTLDGQIINAVGMRNEGFVWKTEFDVSELKQGIYLYQLVEGQTVLTGKFIKR